MTFPSTSPMPRPWRRPARSCRRPVVPPFHQREGRVGEDEVYSYHDGAAHRGRSCRRGRSGRFRGELSRTLRACMGLRSEPLDPVTLDLPTNNPDVRLPAPFHGWFLE